jgi:hypothetical protein
MIATEHPLSILAVPAFNGLTQDQARGITCVWGGTVLTDETAVDLGERLVRRPGERVGWYPRACRPCALRQAMDALVAHSQSCERCTDGLDLCAQGLGLVRAVRQARR